jgi:hypothetical protein
MRQANRNQCIFTSVLSVPATRLIQPYPPQEGAPEYSLIVTELLIGMARRIGCLTRYMY